MFKLENIQFWKMFKFKKNQIKNCAYSKKCSNLKLCIFKKCSNIKYCHIKNIQISKQEFTIRNSKNVYD
jgi:hypothetical protein